MLSSPGTGVERSALCWSNRDASLASGCALAVLKSSMEQVLALGAAVLTAIALGVAGSRALLSAMLMLICRDTVGNVNTVPAVDPDTTVSVGFPIAG
jgi:hypothetical protein